VKQQVITVHGINTDGRWQTEIRRALEPHFDCRDFKYGDYRNLGLLTLLLEPRTLLALLVVTYAFAIPGALHGPALFIPLLFVSLAFLFARQQRLKALERFEEDLSKREQEWGYPRPHVIAHCFGTYLTGWALRRSSGLRFDSVILAGAILPSGYDWPELYRSNPRAFRRLRNEVGRRDWVGWLTCLSFPFCTDLGLAGLRGFRARDGESGVAVHDVTSPYGSCPACRLSLEPSVHNVRVQELTRSDRFIQSRHAQLFWRPFLWGIDPEEYEYFLDTCSTAARLERADRSDPKLRICEEELGETRWTFLGQTLNDEIRARVPGVSLADMAYGIHLIWNAVDKAMQEEDKDPIQSRDQEILLPLKPEAAILKAVTVLLRR
jgi:pimeloyl-ACP methyl ester carboxylesterase